jgi:hypothetical protein
MLRRCLSLPCDACAQADAAKKAQEEAAATKKAQEEAAAAKKAQEEAAAAKKAQEEAAAAKKAQEEAAASKKAQEEAAAAKKAQEEAAAAKKAQEEAAAAKKAQEEAAAKRSSVASATSPAAIGIQVASSGTLLVPAIRISPNLHFCSFQRRSTMGGCTKLPMIDKSTDGSMYWMVKTRRWLLLDGIYASTTQMYPPFADFFRGAQVL